MTGKVQFTSERHNATKLVADFSTISKPACLRLITNKHVGILRKS